MVAGILDFDGAVGGQVFMTVPTLAPSRSASPCSGNSSANRSSIALSCVVDMRFPLPRQPGFQVALRLRAMRMSFDGLPSHRASAPHSAVADVQRHALHVRDGHVDEETQ
jgi:hypothetical protein